MRLRILILCLLMPIMAMGQSRNDLENKKRALLQAIQQTEDELAITKKDKNASLGQLHALQNKLADRQKLIVTMNEELNDISTTITSSSSELQRLRSRLDQLKLRYAQSIRYAYETRSSYAMLAYLFGANDFNDAMRRLRYLKKFRDFRIEQVDQIKATEGQIKNKIGILAYQKSQKDALLSNQMQQKQALQRETNETDQVVHELKGKEKQLLVSIEKNRKAARQLDRAINEVIRREIELARKKAEDDERRRQAALAEEENRRNNRAQGSGITTTYLPAAGRTQANSKRNHVSAPSYSLSLTPEVTALSNSFAANRGRLPWPVEKGFIAEPFGRHPHSLAEKVMVENDGVDIQTTAGATARAVFAGTVGSVLYIPGMGQSVLINHGQFFTSYSRLSNVTVKKGDKVHIKQPLGTVILNDEGVPEIHFELWKVGSNDRATPVDPSTWIAR